MNNFHNTCAFEESLYTVTELREDPALSRITQGECVYLYPCVFCYVGTFAQMEEREVFKYLRIMCLATKVINLSDELVKTCFSMMIFDRIYCQGL